MLTGLLVEAVGVFAKRSAESHSRPGKRSAAGEHHRCHSRLCAGWRYAYPAYGSLP